MKNAESRIFFIAPHIAEIVPVKRDSFNLFSYNVLDAFKLRGKRGDQMICLLFSFVHMCTFVHIFCHLQLRLTQC